MTDKPRILVVESETSVAMTLVFWLTRAGRDVASASTAGRALRLAQAGDFDLITLAVDLPDMNGFELACRLKTIPHLRTTPVIFMAGNHHEEKMRRALDFGAVDYIIKPFEATDFIFRIIAHAKAKFFQSDVPDEQTDTDAKRLCYTP